MTSAKDYCGVFIANCMGACELCGKEGVSTKKATVTQALLECCNRCIESLGLTVEREAINLAFEERKESRVIGRGVKGIDIMSKEEMELAGDFHTRIREARIGKGLSQENLAKKMNEKIAVIQKAENGIRPTDTLISKFSKTLSIELFVEKLPNNHRLVVSKDDRQLTISDVKDQDVQPTSNRRVRKKTRRFGVSRSGSRSRRK